MPSEKISYELEGSEQKVIKKLNKGFTFKKIFDFLKYRHPHFSDVEILKYLIYISQMQGMCVSQSKIKSFLERNMRHTSDYDESILMKLGTEL